MTGLPHLYLPRSPKPLLLMDQDGPLAAFDDLFYERVVERGWQLDVSSPAEQVHRYFSDHIVDEIERAESRRMTEEPGWFRELPVVPGSQEGVARLMEAGVDIWICTKPMEGNPTCASDKYEWVAEHFPDLAKRVIVTPNKGLVVGDVLLDDAPLSDWFPYACWTPVIYECGYNGGGSDWGHLPRWTWDQDIEILLEHLDTARSGQAERPVSVVE